MTTCEHGITLAAYVEKCAECGAEVVRIALVDEIERLRARLVSAETYRDAARANAERLRVLIEAKDEEIAGLRAEQDNAGFIPWRLAQDALDESAAEVKRLRGELAGQAKSPTYLADTTKFWHERAVEAKAESDRLREDLALSALAGEHEQAEVERLRQERDALQRRLDHRIATRPKVSRRDLYTRNKELRAELERLRAELRRLQADSDMRRMRAGQLREERARAFEKWRSQPPLPH